VRAVNRGKERKAQTASRKNTKHGRKKGKGKGKKTTHHVEKNRRTDT